MGLLQIHLIAVYSMAVIYGVTLTIVSGDDVFLQKRSDRNRLDMENYMESDGPRKRPFCNAFTGCGKKRSDESLGSFIDLHPEPAADEVGKEIMSEAKLWEAIQQARAELERRRQPRLHSTFRDLPVGLTTSNFRRKRSIIMPEPNMFREYKKISHQ